MKNNSNLRRSYGIQNEKKCMINVALTNEILKYITESGGSIKGTRVLRSVRRKDSGRGA